MRLSALLMWGCYEMLIVQIYGFLKCLMDNELRQIAPLKRLRAVINCVN
jgi:hypothetical protein